MGGKSHSVPLSESAVYFRCHSQFVRTRPAADDDYLKLIKAGKLTAAEACIRIMNESSLDQSGKPEKKLHPDGRPLKVLRTFQAFHMTWFPNKEFIRHETEIFTTNIYDVNEMGYHLTFNLFGKDTRYSEIVLRPTSFRGVRHSSKPATNLLEPASNGEFNLINDKKWAIFADDNAPAPWSPLLVETGKLVGLRPLDSDENLLRFAASKRGLLRGQKRDYSPSSSLGAGILGTAPYLLLNSHQNSKGGDGGLSMHRSWSKAVFSDLLCRSLPVIREEDATEYVQQKSQIAFRKERSCMQCHASIDPMAATIRHVSTMRPGDARGKENSPRIISLFEMSEASETEVSDADEKFPLRPPNGKLYYRNLSGKLVNQKVKDIQSLGAAIAESDDLYVCAAKRYFEFMTGVSVEIGDFTTDDFLNAGPKELEYRKFVVKLGLNLKESQNLKKMVQEIIESPFYRQSGYESPL